MDQKAHRHLRGRVAGLSGEETTITLTASSEPLNSLDHQTVTQVLVLSQGPLRGHRHNPRTGTVVQRPDAGTNPLVLPVRIELTTSPLPRDRTRG